MIGQIFGKLKVIGENRSDRSGTATWICLCECGKKRIVAGSGLRAGRNKSCGCASPRFTTERTKKHGLSRSRVYRIWNGMRCRCANPNDTAWKNYGGRGITVCERWKKFENFFEDMGHPPTGKSLDRIDNNKGYSKENCRWATSKEQCNNTRRSKIIEINGVKMTLGDLAKLINVKPNTLLYAIKRKI